jgi:hypothetical protein
MIGLIFGTLVVLAILVIQFLFSKRISIGGLFIENKSEFIKKVDKHFRGLSNNRVPEELLNQIVEVIADRLRKNYIRFWSLYFDSRKRYSRFKKSDIEHYFIYYEITLILENETPDMIRGYSKILFNMNEVELDAYNQSMHDYLNK